MHKSKRNDKLSAFEDTNGDYPSKRFLLRIATGIKISSGRAILTVILGAAISAIAFNAIILQPSRHPAPIFAAVEAARTVKEKPVGTIATQIPMVTRPKKDLVIEKESDAMVLQRADRAGEKKEQIAAKSGGNSEKIDRSAIQSTQPSHSQNQHKLNPRIIANDALGEFIRAGIVPPAPIPIDADPRLATIQRNLQRLGYAVGKPDGLMGPGTRTAIEKFERDRKWPITGEVSQKLLRELGTTSAGNRI